MLDLRDEIARSLNIDSMALRKSEASWDDLYLRIAPFQGYGNNNNPTTIQHTKNMFIARASGGAWVYFGQLKVDVSSVTMGARTVESMVFGGKSPEEQFIFDICNPDYPNNVLDFAKKVAFNADRANKIRQRRTWLKINQTRRELKKCKKDLEKDQKDLSKRIADRDALMNTILGK